jgi:hypothetical protein
MEFYSVKLSKRVEVPDTAIQKRRTTNHRYTAVAITVVDGAEVKLTKFISKATFDQLDVPEAQPAPAKSPTS